MLFVKCELMEVEKHLIVSRLESIVQLISIPIHLDDDLIGLNNLRILKEVIIKNR